jgi:anti-sigma-K factor RskA
MTEPTGTDVLTLATPYALHAMTDGELAEVDRLVAGSPAAVAHAFADEVRAVRETMAVVSTATAIEPPDSLRDRLLASVSDAPVVDAPMVQLRPKKEPSQRLRWRTATLATAAAVAIGLGGLGVGWVLHPRSSISTQDQIFAASDVKTVTGDIPTGGTATVVWSRERNAAFLVMNNVAPPAVGTVYQMWLVGDEGPHSAGTMGRADVGPSTTAVLKDLDNSQTLAFTVEPGSGSDQPTTPVFAQLPLV